MDSATTPIAWSLIKTVADARSGLDKRPAFKIKRLDTASNLLLALERFASQLESFFSTGFAGKALHKLVESKYLPPEYVHNLIVEQISFDMDGILRANSQRKIDDRTRSALEFADRLGYEILIPAIVANLISPATVYTYFQKSLFIRLIPYARVAFVAIPFSAIEYPQDFLALPHELGHYVYRFGKFDKDGSESSGNSIAKFCEKHEEGQNWYDPWLEEIFADVFGCIFAGPRLANSFINLSRRAQGKAFNDNDGHHPPPFLRPYVYLITLEKLASLWNIELGTVIDQLKNKWKTQLRDETEVFLPGQHYPVLLERALEIMREDVIWPMLGEGEPLHDLVQQLKPGTKDGPGKYDQSLFRRWWGSVTEWNDLFQPDGHITPLVDWDTIVPSHKIPPVPDLVQVAAGAGSDTATLNITLDTSRSLPNLKSRSGRTIKPKEIELGKTGTPFDDLLTKLQAPGLVATDDWFQVLTYGNWIDKGPGGGNAHT